MTNFIDFGLDPDCIMLHKFKIRTGFGPSQLKRIAQFLLLKICILLNFWTWIFNFLKFLDYGWTWTEFQKFRTGSGSQNTTVRSSLQFTTSTWTEKMYDKVTIGDGSGTAARA